MKEITDGDETTFEILFWRVFKNKYLVSIIFNQIYLNEWIEYDDFKQIHYNNRMKFKDTKLLGLMIKQRKFQLLKYKLNIPDEPIEITKDCLEKLFNLGSIQGTLERKENYTDELINDIIIFKEIFNLLLKLKISQMKEFDLPYISLSFNQGFSINLEAFTILIENELTTCIPITLKCLEYLISRLCPSILNHVINTIKTTISKNSSQLLIQLFNEFKENSLQFVFKSGSIEKYLDFILNEPDYYSPPKSDDHRIPLNKLSFGSIQLKHNILLFELDYVKQYESNYFKNRFNEFKCVAYSSLQEFMELIDQNILSSRISGFEKNKQFHLMLSKEYPNLYYNNYIHNYHEIIKGLPFDHLLRVTFSDFNVDLLKLVILNHNEIVPTTLNCEYKSNIVKFIGRIYKEEYYIAKRNNGKLKDSFFEFVKLYTSDKVHEKLSNPLIDNYIIYMLPDQSNSNKDYQELLYKSFEVSCIFRDNNMLGSIDSFIQPCLIKDKQTVDLIIHSINNGFKVCKKRIDFLFKEELIQFNSYELSEYFNSLLGILLNDDGQISTLYNLGNYYKFPFLKAIGECDIKTLEYLNDTNISINFTYSLLDYKIYIDQSLKLLLLQSVGTINNLLNYLNGNGFKNFSDTLFQIFFNLIITLDNQNEIIVPDTYLGRIIQNFIQSILTIQPKLLKFFLKNVICSNKQTCTKLESNQYIQLIDNGFSIKNINYSIFTRSKMELYNNIYKSQHIIECFDLVIQYFNWHPSFRNILNMLYLKLIISIDVTIDQVFYCHQLFKFYGIKVIESSYHSFYYLSIKSIKLIKYFMDRPFIFSLLGKFERDHGLLEIDLEREEDDNHYSLQDYFKGDEFTFEFIYSNSFDEILHKLIQSLSISLSKYKKSKVKCYGINDRDYFTTTLNSDLEYFLNIKRVDLFFNHMEYIQEKLKDQQYRVAEFPYIDEENTNIRSFLYSDKVLKGAKKLLNDDEFNKFKLLSKFIFK